MDLMESNAVNVLKLPFKARNQVLDAFFYDVPGLGAEELASLSPWVDRKGSLLVVSPGHGIRPYASAVQFMTEQLARGPGNVQALAVAGVGSSVIGTAALARQVANHYGFDVLGIVTGYGLADVVEEALGGWFFYGQIDRLRYQVEDCARQLGGLDPDNPTLQRLLARLVESLVSPLNERVPGDLDIGALHDLVTWRFLFRQPCPFRLIVGHSKGNVMISYVLNHIVTELKAAWDGSVPREPFNNLAVVTLGAVVNVPPELVQSRHVAQFLGELDSLGRINSDNRWGTVAPHRSVPGAGHHLRRSIPYFLPVEDLLRQVELPAPPPAPPCGSSLVVSRAGARATATAGAVGAGGAAGWNGRPRVDGRSAAVAALPADPFGPRSVTASPL